MFRRLTYPAAVLILLLMGTGCSQDPKPVHLQSDQCAHCKMMISDARFAAQIVNENGKAVKFDAIECMASYYNARADRFQQARLWVSDFNDPGTWIEVEDAVFVKSEQIQSPMGESLLALENKELAREHVNEYPGRILTWSEIREL